VWVTLLQTMRQWKNVLSTAVRAAPGWALPAGLAVAWFATPAMSTETQYKLWTLGLYSGPSQPQQ
jgi:hypothetical protein